MGNLLSRRRWLQLGLGAAALLPLNALAERLGGTTPSAPIMAEADALLRWTRQFNTVQSIHRARFGKYVHADELTTSMIERLRKTSALPAPNGAEIVCVLSPNADAYKMAIRDPRSGLAYRTDERGVILVGTADQSLVAAHSEKGFGFTATPIKPTISGRAPSVLNRSLSYVAAFFFPALHAEGICFCGSCEGPGACLCGTEGCCNNGSEPCVWCCPKTCCPA